MGMSAGVPVMISTLSEGFGSNLLVLRSIGRLSTMRLHKSYKFSYFALICVNFFTGAFGGWGL